MDRNLGLTIDIPNTKISAEKYRVPLSDESYDVIRGYEKNLIYIKTPTVKRASSEFKYQNIESIIFCGELSKFSYNDLNDCRNCPEHVVFLNHFDGEPIFIRHDESEAWIFKKDNALYVSFRGTSSLKDATTDLYALKKTFTIGHQNYGKVHKGFYNYYMKIRQQLHKHIVNYLNDDSISKEKKKIIFTGHSLGSCSILCALETAVLYPALSSRIMCVTFGAPRVGDKQFRDSCKTYLRYVYRIVNDDDPIPRAPTRLRFTHSHPEINIDENSKVSYLKKTKQSLLNLGLQTIVSCLPCISNPVTDHYMDNYLEQLHKCKNYYNIIKCPSILAITKFDK